MSGHEGATCSIATSKCDFKCTGADYSHLWAQLHGPFLGQIGCEVCHDHAEELFKFLHDVVNLGLGKPLFDEENYKKVYAQVLCVSKDVPGLAHYAHENHTHEEASAKHEHPESH